MGFRETVIFCEVIQIRTTTRKKALCLLLKKYMLLYVLNMFFLYVFMHDLFHQRYKCNFVFDICYFDIHLTL